MSYRNCSAAAKHIFSSVCLLTLLAHTVRADEWQQAVSVPLSIDYDSNTAMTSQTAEGLWRLKIAPAYSLIGTLGQDEIRVSAGLNIEQPSNQRTVSSRQDPNLSAAWRHQTGTADYRLALQHDQASSRITALEESGLLVRDGTRRSTGLSGSAGWELSERLNLTGSADYKTVRYDAGTLTDFDTTALNLGLSYALSEDSSTFVSAAGSHYAPANGLLPDSDLVSLTAGYKRVLSEHFDFSVQAGSSRTSGRETDTSWQGTAQLRYAGERHTLGIDGGRVISASGEGGFVSADQLRATWAFAVDELVKIGSELSWRDTSGLAPNTMRQVGAWVSREISPFLSVRLNANYRERSPAGAAAVDGYLVGITLNYSHPDF